MKNVTRVEADVSGESSRLRVAAYCRVSKDSERLNGSFDNQVDYYTRVIGENPEWECAGIYSDHAISGLRKEQREGFKRLISDCEKGRVDIVLTKSVSRFARNTVDLLETVRHLKDMGVDVRFEREGIRTLSAEGEVMLTLLAAFAQLESESISENIKWAVRKRMAEGITNGRHRIYGYRWEGFELAINEDEAASVRRIFAEFLAGRHVAWILRDLNADGIPSPCGTSWNKTTVSYILENRAYIGDLHLQKFFVTDPLKGKKKRNSGELPQYIVEGHHAPIVGKGDFERARQMLAERRDLGWRANPSLNLSALSGKVKCSVCGRSYGRGSLHASGAAYWTCMSAKEGRPCTSPAPSIRDSVLKAACADALGTDGYDEDACASAVERIDAHPDRTIVIHLKDGTAHCASCDKDGRRRWSDERRAAKADQQRAFCSKGDGRYYPFTTRIRCASCGASFEHKYNVTKSRGKVGRWRHSGEVTQRCALHGLDDMRLKAVCCEVLGMDEFDGASFMEAVERIDVTADMLLEFHLKNGDARTCEYGRHGRARDLKGGGIR